MSGTGNCGSAGKWTGIPVHGSGSIEFAVALPQSPRPQPKWLLPWSGTSGPAGSDAMAVVAFKTRSGGTLLNMSFSRAACHCGRPRDQQKRRTKYQD